jgi:hypothetical protein
MLEQYPAVDLATGATNPGRDDRSTTPYLGRPEAYLVRTPDAGTPDTHAGISKPLPFRCAFFVRLAA